MSMLLKSSAIPGYSSTVAGRRSLTAVGGVGGFVRGAGVGRNRCGVSGLTIGVKGLGDGTGKVIGLEGASFSA